MSLASSSLRSCCSSTLHALSASTHQTTGHARVMRRPKLAKKPALRALATEGPVSDLRLERVFEAAGGLLDDLRGQLELLRVLVHAGLQGEQLAVREVLARKAAVDQAIHRDLALLDVRKQTLER